MFKRLFGFVVITLFMTYTAQAGLCDLLFSRHAEGSSGGYSYGSAGGTTTVTHTHVYHRHTSQGSSGGYSYGSAGGTPTQVLGTPLRNAAARFRSVLRRPVTIIEVTPEAPAAPAKPVVGTKCDCNCPNCTCNKQEPLTAKKE